MQGVGRFVATIGLGLGLLLAGVGPAIAHPAGGRSVNTYDGLLVEPAAIRVDHVEDLAEWPALAVVRDTDTDGDLVLTGVERETLARTRCAAAVGRIRLTMDGATVPLGVTRYALRQDAGSGGLPVLRIECDLLGSAAFSSSRTSEVSVRVASVTDVGWREITINGSGMTLVGSDVPATSASARLTAYPVDAVTDPTQVSAAHATVAVGGPAASTLSTAVVPASRPGAWSGPFTGRFDAAVARAFGAGGGVSPLVVAGLLVAAALVGTTHALAPGHGKTVMAAVALAAGGSSRRARLADALAVGLTVTVAHTASVLTLASVLWVLGSVLPVVLLSALEVLSGLLVVAVGASLFRAAQRRRAHGPAIVSGSGHGHQHGHGHGHGQAHAGSAERLGRARILGIGVAGGLTPSPTALILLLAATAAGKAWLGALAVLAFGAGLAVTLVAVGVITAVFGARWRGRRTSKAGDRWTRLRGLAKVSPLIPSLAVVTAGGLLTLRGIGAVWGG